MRSNEDHFSGDHHFESNGVAHLPMRLSYFLVKFFEIACLN